MIIKHRKQRDRVLVAAAGGNNITSIIPSDIPATMKCLPLSGLFGSQGSTTYHKCLNIELPETVEDLYLENYWRMDEAEYTHYSLGSSMMFYRYKGKTFIANGLKYIAARYFLTNNKRVDLFLPNFLGSYAGTNTTYLDINNVFRVGVPPAVNLPKFKGIMSNVTYYSDDIPRFNYFCNALQYGGKWIYLGSTVGSYTLYDFGSSTLEHLYYGGSNVLKTMSSKFTQAQVHVRKDLYPWLIKKVGVANIPHYVPTTGDMYISNYNTLYGRLYTHDGTSWGTPINIYYVPSTNPTEGHRYFNRDDRKIYTYTSDAYVVGPEIIFGPPNLVEGAVYCNYETNEVFEYQSGSWVSLGVAQTAHYDCKVSGKYYLRNPIKHLTTDREPYLFEEATDYIGAKNLYYSSDSTTYDTYVAHPWWGTLVGGIHPMYVVKLEPENGTYYKDLFSDDGAVVDEPETPTKNGYTFLGWYLPEWKVSSIPTTEPVSPVEGDRWYDAATNTLYTYKVRWKSRTIPYIYSTSTPGELNNIARYNDRLYIYNGTSWVLYTGATKIIFNPAIGDICTMGGYTQYTRIGYWDSDDVVPYDYAPSTKEDLKSISGVLYEVGASSTQVDFSTQTYTTSTVLFAKWEEIV